jgi:hypothetical protein
MKVQHSVSSQGTSFKFERVLQERGYAVFRPRVPRQVNGVECGVYSLKTTTCPMEGGGVSHDIKYCASQNAGWVDYALRSEFALRLVRSAIAWA